MAHIHTHIDTHTSTQIFPSPRMVYQCIAVSTELEPFPGSTGHLDGDGNIYTFVTFGVTQGEMLA